MYLGLDSSTQSLKALLIDSEAGEILSSASVNFTTDLPQYNSPNGVLENKDPLVKHSNPMPVSYTHLTLPTTPYV